MTSGPAKSLSTLLAIEKESYLLAAMTNGGTAAGFRGHIFKLYQDEPLRFDKSLLEEALMEATTKKWQAPARERGPDLFSLGGLLIPETLTRPTKGLYLSGEDLDGEDADDAFEKVHRTFATVNDLFEDATIKLRNAARASTKAERKMQAFDEARRRARGNMSAFLKDLADKG